MPLVVCVSLLVALGELDNTHIAQLGVADDSPLVGDGDTLVYPRPPVHAILALLCVPAMTFARAVRLFVGVRTLAAQSDAAE